MAGLALLVIGVLSIPGTMSFVSQSVVTEGTVLGVDSRSMGENGFTVLATVTFIPEGGRTTVSTSNTMEGGLVEWNKLKDRIGESVTVRYGPANPTNARINSFFQLWGGSIIPIVIGGVFLIFGRGVFDRKP